MSLIQGRLVWVLDDDEATQHLMSRYLKEHDCAVECFKSADAAIAVLETGRMPNLVFLDLALEYPSHGSDFLRHRITRDLMHIPVMIVSGSERPSDVRNMYRLGANAYLVKPHNVGDLVSDAVRFWLRWSAVPDAY